MTTTVREALATTIIKKGGQTYSFNVSTSAQPIENNNSSTETRRILIKNPNSIVVYIGFLGVTTANGYPLAQNEVLDLAVLSGQKIYIIAGSTTTVRVFEAW